MRRDSRGCSWSSLAYAPILRFRPSSTKLFGHSGTLRGLLWFHSAVQGFGCCSRRRSHCGSASPPPIRHSTAHTHPPQGNLWDKPYFTNLSGHFHGRNHLTYGVDVAKMRWLGILQRISIGYLLAAMSEIWFVRIIMVDSLKAFVRKYYIQGGNVISSGVSD